MAKSIKGMWMGTVNLKSMVPSAKPKAKPARTMATQTCLTTHKRKRIQLAVCRDRMSLGLGVARVEELDQVAPLLDYAQRTPTSLCSRHVAFGVEVQ